MENAWNYLDFQSRIQGNVTSSVKIARWKNILCDKTKFIKNYLIENCKKLELVVDLWNTNHFSFKIVENPVSNNVFLELQT
jgi:hypothetical protein